VSTAVTTKLLERIGGLYASRRRCAASYPIFDALHGRSNQSLSSPISKPAWRQSAPRFQQRARSPSRFTTRSNAGRPLSRPRASGNRQPYRRTRDPGHRYRTPLLTVRGIEGRRRARRCHLFHHRELQAQQRRALRLHHRRHAQSCLGWPNCRVDELMPWFWSPVPKQQAA
jgi:hypothetical protein